MKETCGDLAMEVWSYAVLLKNKAPGHILLLQLWHQIIFKQVKISNATTIPYTQVKLFYRGQ
jgi:hypothetical protein